MLEPLADASGVDMICRHCRALLATSPPVRREAFGLIATAHQLARHGEQRWLSDPTSRLMCHVVVAPRR